MSLRLLQGPLVDQHKVGSKWAATGLTVIAVAVVGVAEVSAKSSQQPLWQRCHWTQSGSVPIARSAKAQQHLWTLFQASASSLPIARELSLECLLLSFLLASSLPLLVFVLLPTGMGVVFLHGLGGSGGLLPKIFAINDAIAANDEGHHTR
jgi:hypothetical protein